MFQTVPTNAELEDQCVRLGVEGSFLKLQGDPEEFAPADHQGLGACEALRLVELLVISPPQLDMFNDQICEESREKSNQNRILFDFESTSNNYTMFINMRLNQ